MLRVLIVHCVEIKLEIPPNLEIRRTSFTEDLQFPLLILVNQKSKTTIAIFPLTSTKRQHHSVFVR